MASGLVVAQKQVNLLCRLWVNWVSCFNLVILFDSCSSISLYANNKRLLCSTVDFSSFLNPLVHLLTMSTNWRSCLFCLFSKASTQKGELYNKHPAQISCWGNCSVCIKVTYYSESQSVRGKHTYVHCICKKTQDEKNSLHWNYNKIQ